MIKNLVKTQIWNFAQTILEKAGRPPIGCVDHMPEEIHWDWLCCNPGDTFTCEACDRIQPYCRGKYQSAYCDDCWGVIGAPLSQTREKI